MKEKKIQRRKSGYEQRRNAYLRHGFTAVEAGKVLERRCVQEAPKAMLEVCLPVGLR